MTLLLLLACARKPVEVPALIAPPPPTPPPPTAGAVVDGRFVDALYPMSIEVPPRWSAEPGLNPDALRVTLVHLPTGARVELRADPGGTADPLPRPDCTWDFVDPARYRALRLPAPVTAATCIAEDPLQPRVLGYGTVDRDLAWHLDIVLPPTRAREARAALDEVLGTLRFR